MNRIIPVALLALGPIAALADDAPAPPPPQHEFIGKGQFGFLLSRGNSDASSLNANLDVLRYDDNWKNEIAVIALYGKSAGIVSAERWEIRQQTNYNFTPAFFAFGGLHFEHDLFNGFVYQASLTGGVGYKFLDTVSDKLALQVGAGYRRLRPETITKDDAGNVISRDFQDSQGDLIATVGVDYQHAFNSTTLLTEKMYVESGNLNTSAKNDVALTVKMSTKLALSVGYGILYNTNPIPPLKRLDQITTVNLQYSF